MLLTIIRHAEIVHVYICNGKKAQSEKLLCLLARPEGENCDRWILRPPPRLVTAPSDICRDATAERIVDATH